MAGAPSVKDNRLITTKRQGTGHGLGLKSAERVVEKIRWKPGLRVWG